MTLLRKFKSAARRILRQEDGSAALETLLMAPIMMWAFMATLAFFDAYRTEAVSEKAALTVADMISRETDYVNDTYIDGAYGLLKFLSLHDPAPGLRITSMRFHDKDETESNPSPDHYHVVWSKTRGTTRSPLTRSDLNGLLDRLPALADGDRLLLVETWTAFTPRYEVGLQSTEMSSYIFISPRLTQICFNNSPSDPSQAKC